MKIHLHIFISLLAIVLIGCIPFNSPSEPSGINNIGTQSFELLDSNRLEWFTDDKDDF